MRSWIRALRTLRRRSAPERARRTRPLTLETLESRWCPSSYKPYAYVTSYANNSVLRYDEFTGAPAPGPGLTDAYFVAPGSSPMTTPLFAIHAPNSDLIVDSAEDNRIYRYDGRTGAYLDIFAPFTGSLSHPTGIIFSPDGQYFYALSSANNQIIRFDYDGTHAVNPVTLVSDSALGIPVGVVFGPDGNLYVSTLTTNAVLRYDPITGDPLPAQTQTGANFITPGDGGLIMGGGIVFGPDGNLYVANQVPKDILRFNGTDGTALPADGQDGATFVAPGQLDDPAGLVFGPGTSPCSQDLYVVSINSNSVQQYDGTTGAYVGDFIPAGASTISRPRGVTFGRSDPATLNYKPHGGHYHRMCGGQADLPPAVESSTQADSSLASLAVTPVNVGPVQAPAFVPRPSASAVSAMPASGQLAGELLSSPTVIGGSLPGVIPVHLLRGPQFVSRSDLVGQDGLDLM
jgi:DNA-binding beta-propeller fold protein YncE